MQRYREGGTENVGIGRGAPGKKQNQYPGEIKLAIVKERISEGIGYREIARRYNINHNVVMNWERIYLQNGEQGLLEEQRGKQVKEGCPKRGRPKKHNKQVEEDLIAEVQRLRMENDYLKKLNALVQEGRKSLYK